MERIVNRDDSLNDSPSRSLSATANVAARPLGISPPNWGHVQAAEKRQLSLSSRKGLETFLSACSRVSRYWHLPDIFWRVADFDLFAARNDWWTQIKAGAWRACSNKRRRSF